MSINGYDTNPYFTIIIVMVIVSSLIFSTLNWKINIDGCYKGKLRLIKTRKVLLVVLLLLQLIDFTAYKGNTDAVMLGIIMLFSMLSFNAYFYGKKYRLFVLIEFK